MKTLAAALARPHREELGLRAVYLPDPLFGLAGEIVRSANSARPGIAPYSILVSDEVGEDLTDPVRPVVGTGRSIQYRRDDRLAVVCGAHSVPASFSSSFATVAESDFPGSDPASRADLIRQLAGDALAVVAEAAGLSLEFVDVSTAAERLVSVLEALAGAYERLAQGGDAWNVYWLRHVGLGLDVLVQALSAPVGDDGELTVDAALAQSTFAAFGLPHPNSGVSYGRTRRVEEALIEHWGSSEAISLSLQRLRNHPSRPEEHQGTDHSLASLSFADFGQTVAAKDNLLLAWGTPGPDVVGRVSAFSSLTESEFFAPQQGLDSALVVATAEGDDVAIAGEGSAQIVVFTWDAADGVLSSEPLKLVVPASRLPEPEELAATGLSISISGTGVTKARWAGTLEVQGGDLIANGAIEVPRTGSSKVPAKPLSLSVTVPSGDPLAGIVGSAVSQAVYPVVRGTVGVWSFEAKGTGGAYKPGAYRGYEALDEALADAGVAVPVDSTPGVRLRVVAWGSEPITPVSVRAIRQDQRQLAVWMTDPDLETTNEDELRVGGLIVRWRAGTSTDEFLSPLLAAARGGSISAAAPNADIQQSVRGRVESFLTAHVESPELIVSHGHLAIFEDLGDLPDSLTPAADGAVLVPVGRESVLKSHLGFQVSPELRASAEAERFRAAFADLDLANRLKRVSGDGTEEPVWPSRTSWEWAVGSELLDEYLDAYACLVDKAASGTPQDLYWAAFPFSVSIYATGGVKQARAVVLSPLHPLRLAWLASAEAALRKAPAAERLAGVVEAWNLPIVAPQADSSNGRLLAVPIDAGPGQLFLGWSMLVSASVAGHQALEAPARIGALPAPGTSATGLNADAVRSALRTFHRMNPHVSTLSIDLASSSPAPRLDEIDQAIVESISGRELRGGVRVHDSMNRLGEAPLADLERKVAGGMGRPVRWSRYKHDQMGGPQANIRFLQDAGVKVEVSQTDARGSGLLSSVPLRRFSTPVASMPGHPARQLPALQGSSLSAFGRALAAIERSDQGVQISAELFKAALVNDSADWTVTGESLVGASALAEMLAADGSGQMLWEWRPPFLERRAIPQLDARPFVSVVRLPEAVKSQISAHVIKASGTDDSVEHKVREVMETLGTRGIGLSSLMAQGGTHAAGAVGFYLTLKMLEGASLPNGELLVLPIDACDEFLRGLAGETAAANKLRRADLLVVAVEPGGVTLIPVEIKCYGLGSANPAATLPSSATHLTEALGQLESTADLLKQVTDAYVALSGLGPAQSALWRHGFATMVEAAMRLRPAPASGGELLGSTLQGLLDGTTNLRLGRSILCYFGHEAAAGDGTDHSLLLDLEPPANPSSPLTGALVCNTQAAFAYATTFEGDLGRDWQGLVEWALARPEVAPDGVHVEPPTDLAPAQPEPVVEAVTVSPATPSHTPEGGPVPTEPSCVEEGKSTADPSPEATSTGEGNTLASGRGIVGDGVRFNIGVTTDGIAKTAVEFWPSNTALNQMNIGVVGDLGTGKTQFLKSLVYQLRQGATDRQATPVSMLIFDYKRDYHDADFLNSVGGVLQRPFHIPLNVLAIDGDYTPQKAVQAGGAFVDIITKIYGGIGPVQKSKVLMIIKALFADNDGVAPTLGEVLEAYLEENSFDSVAAVLNGFVLNEVFSEDRSELVTMEEMLDDKVLVLAVSDLGADDNLKTALITLFLNKYYEYMLRLTKWPFEGVAPVQLRRLNSFVMVDEATNIMAREFPVLSQLLLQGREFGVGVILASQYVSHFKVGGTNYGETLLTKVVHKVPNTTVADLKAFGFASAAPEMAARVPNLAVHQALVKTLGVDSRFMRGTPYFELDIEGA